MLFEFGKLLIGLVNILVISFQSLFFVRENWDEYLYSSQVKSAIKNNAIFSKFSDHGIALKWDGTQVRYVCGHHDRDVTWTSWVVDFLHKGYNVTRLPVTASKYVETYIMGRFPIQSVVELGYDDVLMMIIESRGLATFWC